MAESVKVETNQSRPRLRRPRAVIGGAMAGLLSVGLVGCVAPSSTHAALSQVGAHAGCGKTGFDFSPTSGGAQKNTATAAVTKTVVEALKNMQDGCDDHSGDVQQSTLPGGPHGEPATGTVLIYKDGTVNASEELMARDSGVVSPTNVSSVVLRGLVDANLHTIDIERDGTAWTVQEQEQQNGTYHTIYDGSSASGQTVGLSDALMDACSLISQYQG